MTIDIDNWRYERKFLISDIKAYEIESIVKFHPAIFSEIFYERSVNNIYLDSHSLTNYFDNIEGKPQRSKVRIRWYENLFGVIVKPILEIKIKNGLLGRKISYPLKPFSIDNNLTIDVIHKSFENSDIPDVTKSILLTLKFSLLTCYIRKYFQSADKKFRITIDSNMTYYHLYPISNLFLNKIIDHSNCILELKYEKEEDDYSKMITNYLPFRVTRSSKYVMGRDLIYY